MGEDKSQITSIKNEEVIATLYPADIEDIIKRHYPFLVNTPNNLDNWTNRKTKHTKTSPEINWKWKQFCVYWSIESAIKLSCKEDLDPDDFINQFLEIFKIFKEVSLQSYI